MELLAAMKKMDSYGKKGEFRKLTAVIRKSVILGICLCGTYNVHI